MGAKNMHLSFHHIKTIIGPHLSLPQTPPHLVPPPYPPPSPPPPPLLLPPLPLFRYVLASL